MFQVLPAPPPKLRHSCSLSAAAATSFQVRCQLNEHLKSEEFELVQRQQARLDLSTSTGLRNWMNLDTFRSQQQQLQSGSSSSSEQNPNLRLVFPPHWLLGQLHKLADGEEQLVGYVVVAQSKQLASIKFLVEQNGLFSERPRSVYYVIAKPELQIGENNSSSQSAATATTNQTSSVIQMHNDRLGFSLVEDPSIQLPATFTFSVPNLKPQNKYKLVIYAQNLANKTPDWLMIQAETWKDELAQSNFSKVSGKALDADNLLSADSANEGHLQRVESKENQEESLESHNSSSQKSIVMRSDQSRQVDQQQQTDNRTSAQMSDQSIDRLTADANSGSGSSLVDKMHQFGLYKDYAISYAKKKPLLAVPVALSLALVLLVTLIWLGGALINLTSSSSRYATSARRRSSRVDADQNAFQEEIKEAEIGDKFLSSPDDSYTSSSNQDQSNNSRPSSNNHNSSTSLLKQQQVNRNETVYTIGSDLNDAFTRFVALDNSTLKMQPNNQQQTYLGSLDRRNLQQPLYLHEDLSNKLASQCVHQRVGSIDRRCEGFVRSQQKQPILVTASELARLEQDIYVQRMKPNVELDDDLLANLSVYSSSMDCQSQQQQQSNCRKQRVAFDLSNQQALSARQFLYPIEMQPSSNQQMLLMKSVQDDAARINQRVMFAGSELCPDYYERGQAILKAGKGSDSGGSYGNTTVDSGRESPPTNELNSASCQQLPASFNLISSSPSNYLQESARLKQLLARQQQISPLSSSSQSRVGKQQDFQDVQLHSNDASEQNSNMLMLMELSMASQESTLQQSVDSFAELPAETTHNVCQLHEMVTSFASKN